MLSSNDRDPGSGIRVPRRGPGSHEMEAGNSSLARPHCSLRLETGNWPLALISSAHSRARFRTVAEAGSNRRRAMKLGVWVMVAALALASTASAQNKKITPKGMGGFSSGTNLQTPDVPEGQKEGPKENRSFQKFINGSVSQARVPSSGVPTPARLPVTAANPAFLALTHLDQRLADGGTQFNTEPPDQGFAIGGTNQCSGGPCALIAVNSAIAAYSTGGQLLGTASMNEFFGLPSAFNRTNGQYGPFLADPRIYFDT